MKNLTLLVCFMVSVCALRAQKTSTQLISTASDVVKTASGASYSWSIGEIATLPFQDRNAIFTQGQQQPKTIIIDVVVYNGITIGDDNAKNNVFTIKDIEKYPNNKLTILNRWGEVVFQADNYQNTWEGKDQNGSFLETGTYYYVFYPSTGSSKVVRGQMLILKP